MVRPLEYRQNATKQKIHAKQFYEPELRAPELGKFCCFSSIYE